MTIAVCKRKQGGGEDLTRFLPSQFLLAQYPATLPGNFQPIQMSGQLIVELRQILEEVVGLARTVIAAQPQDGHFLQMLGNHDFDRSLPHWECRVNWRLDGHHKTLVTTRNGLGQSEELR